LQITAVYLHPANIGAVTESDEPLRFRDSFGDI
jgi:hypothetical protein